MLLSPTRTFISRLLLFVDAGQEVCCFYFWHVFLTFTYFRPRDAPQETKHVKIDCPKNDCFSFGNARYKELLLSQSKTVTVTLFLEP